MIDTCAGADVFTMGFDENALHDNSVSEADLMNATSDVA
jgi:hypothetical protein